MLLSSSPPTSLQQPSANSFFTSIEETSQACNLLGQFYLGLTQIPKTSVHNILFNPAIESISNPKQDNKSITCNNKIYQLAALYAKQAYKNKKKLVEGEELVSCQRQKCKAIGLVVFRFILYKEQIDTISYLFYKQSNLFLLAKIGFQKNIIFQLLLFITPITGVIFILMPLKLLQAEQSQIIN